MKLWKKKFVIYEDYISPVFKIQIKLRNTYYILPTIQ
jgi:hypothetical protein